MQTVPIDLACLFAGDTLMDREIVALTSLVIRQTFVLGRLPTECAG
jgi:hypothetical protein